jgi:D-amino-acid dehydrogenase
MKTAVIGAGIVGVTTAYELALLGHEVSVFERQGTVAADGSFGNAGVVNPGHVLPWAVPGLAKSLLRAWLSADAPLKLSSSQALRHASWLWRSCRAGDAHTSVQNQRALRNLAQFSRDRLLALTRELHLDFDQMPGYLILLRTERELQALNPHLALLRDMGVALTLVDAARCRQLEPALNASTTLHAAVHIPHDGVGNCRQFAHLLKAQAQSLGATFHFGSGVQKLAAGARPSVLMADGSNPSFDAVVLCTGAHANTLLAGLGAKLPMVSVHGYSVTAPFRHFDEHGQPGPHAALLDEQQGVTLSRLGQRMRVSGAFEFGGDATQMAPAALARLYRVLDDWFPGAAVVREAQHWKGACATLPDGPPVLGESGAAGIWLNLGHGAHGWTLACGSARVLAERISGRPAPLDVARFGAARFGAARFR